MKLWLTVLTVAVSLVACTNTVPDSPTASRVAEADAARQILVTVHQDGALALGLVGETGSRYVRRRGYGPTPSVDRTLNQIAREHGLERVRGWPVASISAYCEVFEVAADADVDTLLSDLASDPRIDIAQRMNIFGTLSSQYNDTYAHLQTSVLRLGVEPAHAIATGRGVTVAVIDSQVDSRHPDLRGRIHLDRDLVDSGISRKVAEIHGTAIAGIIASAANNTEGIVGVAPEARLVALRACWAVDATTSGAKCSSFSLAQALELAMGVEPDIINLSLAGPHDPLLAQLIDAAIEKGIVVVAAVAESADSAQSFPASHGGVIAAYSENGRKRAEHPFLLSAPGSEILTTTLDAGYAFFSGNSLAAAHVSGVIALLLEHDPGMDSDRIVQLLTETTTTGADGASINACLAVAQLLTEVDACADSGTAAMAREEL